MPAAPAELLLVFTKPARPGRVKTRLVGALTAEEAASLHQAFLDDLLARLAAAPFAVRLAWALDAADAVPDGPLPGVRQEGDDLGERLYRALAGAGAERVAAVGSDHPQLAAETVAEAFARLRAGADLVLGPAADGGYYLVAARRAALAPELFAGVPWSTPRVLAAQLAGAAARGLRVELLAVGHDVDTPEDLARLAARLAAGEGPPCPSTRSLLAGWGRLPAVRDAEPVLAGDAT